MLTPIFGQKRLKSGPEQKPENNPPSDQTATYRETEVIQSYLRTWGTYDPIESGPSDLKKWGLYSRSVKKCRFWGQKWAAAAAPRPSVHQGQHKKVVFLVSSHDGVKKNGWFRKKMDLGPKNCIFDPKICIWAIRWKYKKRFFSKSPHSPIFKFFVVTLDIIL